MQPPVDVASLPAPAQKILDPKSPAPLRQMAARGFAPGLKPAESLTVLALLAESQETELAKIAQATLDKLPAPLLNGALGGDLPPGVLDVVAKKFATNLTVMEKVLTHPRIAADTVAEVAAIASEAVSELIAVNEERLLANPTIIEKLYMNKATRMSTADRVLELAVRNKIELRGIPAFKEAAAAIVDELIMEPSEEPTPDDLMFKEIDELAEKLTVNLAIEDTHKLDDETGEETVEEKFLPLQEQLARATVSQRIRRAMLGTPSDRALLVRDRNRLVAQAVVRSPMLQENEVVRISSSRNVSDEILRIIAQDKQWSSSHQIKVNLVTNPRCPFAYAAKLIPHMREHELKAIAKSKNVTGAVAKAAKQQLQRRGLLK